MNEVMLSIKLKWCELIAKGSKTIEIRKTRPKINTPFKCYIYCTLNGSSEAFASWGKDVAKWNKGKWGERKGNIIGEFVCTDIKNIFALSHFWGLEKFEKQSCLTAEQIRNYANGNEKCYAWYISDLVVYDKPKELSEFYIIDKEKVKECEFKKKAYTNPDLTNNAYLPSSYVCTKGIKEYEPDWCEQCHLKPLSRPPQSWGYVEGIKSC